MRPPSVHRFAAMGTEVEVLAVRPLRPVELTVVRTLFSEVEAALSRFRPDSELSRLNMAAGRPFQASPLLWHVLRSALAAARSTRGLFDPTVLPALEAAGYRASHAPGTRAAAAPPEPGAGYRRVHLRRGGAVLLESGVRVDLGGFAKGWTVDAAVWLLRHAGSCVVNAGGDLHAVGPGPDGTGWLVGVQDPDRPELDLAVVRLRDGALATSSAALRRWNTQHGPAHHLIDPRTQRPAATGVVAATVLAPTTAQAEVLAKAAFLLGPRRGARYVAVHPGCGAVLIPDDGPPIWTRRMEALRVA